MKRNVAMVSLAMMLLLIGARCSMNRQTPSNVDNAAMEADVRAAIASEVPEKTFAVEINVDNGVVTLQGHAANATQKQQILTAASHVNGVKRVVDHITIQP